MERPAPIAGSRVSTASRAAPEPHTKGAGHEEGSTFVGLDAHKEAISVAVPVRGQEKAVEWQCANEATSVRRMMRKIQKLAPGEVRYCYEAGPCGYALQRWMRSAGAECVVVAPR